MNVNDAMNAFKKAHPDLEITACYDYDNRYFLFEAPDKSIDKDYNDPYYAVDKNSGKVFYYSPAGDYDKFFDALDREIDISSSGAQLTHSSILGRKFRNGVTDLE